MYGSVPFKVQETLSMRPDHHKTKKNHLVFVQCDFYCFREGFLLFFPPRKKQKAHGGKALFSAAGEARGRQIFPPQEKQKADGGNQQ